MILTENNVVEGNKLIAEFMGATYIPDDGIKHFEHYVFAKENAPPLFYITDKRVWGIKQSALTLAPIHAQYHTSWDWLMPVVEKINTCKEENVMDYLQSNLTIGGLLIFADIKTVWLAVVEFIKWKNNLEP